MKSYYLRIVEFDKYIEDISDNVNVNFIGFATTPWHVHGLMASIYRIKKNGAKLKGFIYITPHAQTGYAIDESFFPKIEGIEIKRVQKESSTRDQILKVLYSLFYLFSNKLKKNTRTVYIVEPWTINSALAGFFIKKIKGLQLTHVVYDEGVSTYFPVKYQSTDIPSYIYNQYLKIIVFGKGLRYLSSKPNFVLAKLFIDTENGLVENKDILPYYLKALSESPKRLKKVIEFSDNSVIICTTAWERTEIIGNEDVKLIQSIDRVLKNMGYRVWYKPHPRDKNFETLYPNVSVLDRDLSIEGILLNCTRKPKVMISISSTILVTSKLFFGLNTIDLSKILDEANIGKYVDEITSFQNVFGNYVLQPKNIEELRGLMK